MSVAAGMARDFFRADLDTAWRRVDRVPGPELGDVGAPLAQRNAVFRERLAAFLSVFRCVACGLWRQPTPGAEFCRCPPEAEPVDADLGPPPIYDDDPDPLWPPP